MRKKWLLFGCLFIPVLLFLLLLPFVLPPRITPEEPLPIPNAYDVFVSAGSRIVPPEGGDWKTTDRESIQKHVEANAQALEQLQNAFRLESRAPAYSSDSMETTTNLPALKALAQSLGVRSRWHLQQGRPREAVQDGAAQLRLAFESERGGPLIHSLVARASEQMGVASLKTAYPHLSPEEQREIARELWQLQEARTPFQEIQKEELQFMQRELARRPFYQRLLMRLMTRNDVENTLRRFEKKFKAQQAETSALILETALEAHRGLTGFYPEELSGLVPGILPELPVNPHTGQPPLYVHEGDTFELNFPGGSQ